MPPVNLLDLPIEVLVQATARLPSLRDVSSLSRSSRRLNESLNPELYALDATSLRSRALFWASLHGSCQVARKALRAGTDVDAYCENSDRKRDWEARDRHYGTDSTPLLIAAAYGHVDLVSLLLEQGADQRWTDYDDSTALALACRHGHADVVRLLLSKSTADINFSNRYLDTPLILATRSGHLNVVKILLELDNIDLDAITGFGTALVYAAVGGRADIFDAIHDRGACVFGIVPRNRGVPDLAFVCGLRVPRSFAIAEEMLALGADANAASETGQTALMSACGAGNVNVVKMLLSRNVQLFAVDSHGETALHYACGLESPELAELLISRGLDPLTGSGNSRTSPLHCAALSGGCDVVKLLLGKGADPTSLDESDSTAIAKASERRDSDVLLLLLAHCANQNLGNILNSGLLVACEPIRTQNAKILLQAGADPNYVSPSNQYPLLVACSTVTKAYDVPSFERVELVKALLDAGADANGAGIEVPRGFGPYIRRPLHDACDLDFEQVVELLLSRGANPNLDPGMLLSSMGKSGNPNIVRMLIGRGLILENDNYGREALVQACQDSKKPGAAEVVDIFLEYGVDPRISTKEFSNAMSWAISHGNSDIVKSLLSRGVDCNQRHGFQQSTPLSDACTKGRMEIVQILLQHGADPSGLKSKPPHLIKYSITYYATDFDVLKLLMSLGWDSIAMDSDSTAILEVAKTGDLRAFRELVSRGADPFVSSKEGQTVLHIVCAKFERTCRFIEHLLELGLDPNAKEPPTGFTPLHRAVKSRLLRHVKALVEYGGTDLHIRDNDGKTALDIAVDLEETLICDYITAKVADQGTA